MNPCEDGECEHYAKLVGERDALLAIVKAVEISGPYDGCPVCETAAEFPHHKDCALADALLLCEEESRMGFAPETGDGAP